MISFASTGNSTLDYVIAVVCVVTIITVITIEAVNAVKQKLTFLEWIDRNPLKVFCLGLVVIILAYTIAHSQFGGGMAYSSIGPMRVPIGGIAP